jgi:hypothetical protein
MPRELTEVGRLFRAKLRYIREQERPRRRTLARQTPRWRTASLRLANVESPPAGQALLSSGEIGRALERHPEDSRTLGR